MNLRSLERLGIRHLATDSRRVRRGDTFIAYPGESDDGRRHIAQAIARGAASVLWEKRGFEWNPAWRVPNLGVARLRARAGVIASHVYGNPSAQLWMIGVTGTNGKTTCSQWVARALNDCGVRTAVIGTLGYGLRADALKPLANTTPDAAWLHAQLAQFARRGARAVSMEVSSIGLDQDRVAGVQFDAALFTNLTREHLEYHRTMRRYQRAKARLFECDTLRHAVINLDDRFGADLARRVRRRGLDVIGYGFGRHGDGARLARVVGRNLATGAAGVRFDVKTPWGSARIESPTLGRYNASNLLGSLATLLVSDIRLKDAVASLRRLDAVPGRMQKIGGGRAPLAVVDYAHTPDALEQVLKALRELVAAQGELWCVFGCGGERDRGKRPLMGAVAARLADRVVITSDNPRGENPLAIIANIEKGVRGEHARIPDRKRAIAHALRAARRGDVVLIAGKGHEAYQEVNGVRRAFSDAAVARAVLQEWRT